MKRILIFAPALLIILSSCNSNNSGKTADRKTSETVQSNPIYKNGIVIRENGLKVEKAMLLKEDESELPADNKVAIGETIFCRLFVSGWKEEKGMVSIGASEKILSSTGGIILNNEDLFANGTGITQRDDVQIFTLKATITELYKSIHDFEVRFRVWDKYGMGDATGHFEFHLK